MKQVDGEAFRRAREQIRIDSNETRGKPGQPATGTQEWLAQKANCSVRVIQKLERGIASIRTVDTVSPYLGIQGRELMSGYGQESYDTPHISDHPLR